VSAKPDKPRRSRPAILVWVSVAVAIVLVAVIAGLAIGQTSGSGAASGGQIPAAQIAHNPNVDPGTPLPGTVAPQFTLTDQFGAKVSLSQFRGKVSVLAFVDARCTTVCPLTTVSMTEAVRMLGPAAAGHVQLLGMDPNPLATADADVRAYSAAHHMTHSWDFLTGTPAALASVWKAYHVYVAASHNNIDHEPAIYLIDAEGRERTLYLTQMAYAGVGQQADLLAEGIARLLPGHPVPHGLVSMKLAKPIGPAQSVSLPVIGGASQAKTIKLGPGQPHLVVFLASWVSEISDLRAELDLLAAYQRQAAASGWPSLVAVDESQTETSPTALPALLNQAGGAKLGFPVVADTSGRVADGYGVGGIPWIVITSATGTIVYKHDAWLTAKALDAAAGHAAK
jgi:cytochrome oxidase Cu insertion factor (SCO1/SenC/PrrC family)